MAVTVAIVNYGTGNLHSVYRKLCDVKATPVLTETGSDLRKCDKILLPGVGHFKSSISHLKETGLYDDLNEAVLVKRKPVLGICLGLELIAKISEEGNCIGFGWLDAAVIKFEIRDGIKYKVPHIGWNTVDYRAGNCLFKNINDHTEFYFLHSYHLNGTDEAAVAKTKYEYEFTSAIEKENIFGTQFHPEKSHSAGEELLKNFIRI